MISTKVGSKFVGKVIWGSFLGLKSILSLTKMPVPPHLVSIGFNISSLYPSRETLLEGGTSFKILTSDKPIISSLDKISLKVLNMEI